MKQVAQMAIMAVIVATLAYVPFGIALALLLGIAGVPIGTVITFGDALGTAGGLLAWWLLFFTLAMVYSGFMFPWGHARGFTEES